MSLKVTGTSGGYALTSPSFKESTTDEWDEIRKNHSDVLDAAPRGDLKTLLEEKLKEGNYSDGKIASIIKKTTDQVISFMTPIALAAGAEGQKRVMYKGHIYAYSKYQDGSEGTDKKFVKAISKKSKELFAVGIFISTEAQNINVHKKALTYVRNLRGCGPAVSGFLVKPHPKEPHSETVLFVPWKNLGDLFDCLSNNTLFSQFTHRQHLQIFKTSAQDILLLTQKRSTYSDIKPANFVGDRQNGIITMELTDFDGVFTFPEEDQNDPIFTDITKRIEFIDNLRKNYLDIFTTSQTPLSEYNHLNKTRNELLEILKYPDYLTKEPPPEWDKNRALSLLINLRENHQKLQAFQYGCSLYRAYGKDIYTGPYPQQKFNRETFPDLNSPCKPFAWRQTNLEEGAKTEITAVIEGLVAADPKKRMSMQEAYRRLSTLK